ncbi:MAG: transporter substrate-binding domain-containing protein [Solirubrobacterales bacterium]
MNKKKFLILIPIVVFLIIFANRLIVNQYNINIIQYFYKSQPLTDGEKQWLNQHGPIIYGADKNSPPLRYVDSETGQYKGVSVDLTQALSIELGVEIKFKPQVFSDALVSLDKAQIDIFDIFPSSERGKSYLFSDPIYNIRGVILVPSGNTSIRSFTDLKNKKVALVNGDYAVEYLNSALADVNFVKTDDMEHAIKVLMAGQADCVVGDEPVISYFTDILKIKDKTDIIAAPLYEKGVVLAIPKSEPELLGIINKGVLSLKEKNTAEKIQQKWFGISTPITRDSLSEKVFTYIWIVTALFCIIFYFLYYWNEKLKQEVKRQTEELFISKNDLETIFDGVTYFMVVVDINYNILNANRAFCTFTNIDKNDVIKMNCRDFPDILFSEPIKELIYETFNNNIEKNGEITINFNVFEIGTFPLFDKNKNTVKVLLAIKDVTQFKINEKRLLQSDKMAAVGQLAAGIAHEIRNPLGLIRSYSYILKKRLISDDKKSLMAIEIIDDAVDRSSNIINNLLNFSRMSGDIKELVNLKEFIQGILSLEDKAFGNSDIHPVLICPENLVCSLNQESLKHILINLISNSIDAMNNGGTLKIECASDDLNLLLTVSDTGIGIEEKDMDNIFHPFFTTKPLGKGTGLGLYIIYNEVQKFGGKITVDSKLSEGTTFKIILPLGDD